MRIITGTAKGTKLKTPRGLDTRPTADRVKESLFNILGPRVLDAAVLDLFAGTGNLGLEALSRGASKAIFIDHDSRSIQMIRDNIELTKLTHQAQIHKADVLRTVDRLMRESGRFHLIFCDPPYNKGFVRAVLDKLDASDILMEGGIIIMEHSRHEPVAGEWKQLQLLRTERYGETRVSFLTTKID
jgi:16S rRNA (guanine966-N2)-methyltransferase